MTKLVLDELNGEQRPAFTAWLQTNLGCGLGAVPNDKVSVVEAAIQSFAAGEVRGPIAQGGQS